MVGAVHGISKLFDCFRRLAEMTVGDLGIHRQPVTHAWLPLQPEG
jgi:hypothetical protein